MSGGGSHGKTALGRVADVFVIEIDVDEVAQHVLIVEEMATQTGVCRGEQIERLAGSCCFDGDLLLSPCELP